MDREGVLILHIARLKDIRFRIAVLCPFFQQRLTLVHQYLILWDLWGGYFRFCDLSQQILTESCVSRPPGQHWEAKKGLSSFLKFRAVTECTATTDDSPCSGGLGWVTSLAPMTSYFHSFPDTPSREVVPPTKIPFKKVRLAKRITNFSLLSYLLHFSSTFERAEMRTRRKENIQVEYIEKCKSPL